MSGSRPAAPPAPGGIFWRSTRPARRRSCPITPTAKLLPPPPELLALSPSSIFEVGIPGLAAQTTSAICAGPTFSSNRLRLLAALGRFHLLLEARDHAVRKSSPARWRLPSRRLACSSSAFRPVELLLHVAARLEPLALGLPLRRQDNHDNWTFTRGTHPHLSRPTSAGVRKHRARASQAGPSRPLSSSFFSALPLDLHLQDLPVELVELLGLRIDPPS